MLLSNSFEGGVHNQEITSVNSGGASGTAFTLISDPGPRYTTTRAAHGSVGAVFSDEYSWISWEGLPEGNGTRWARVYVWADPPPDTAAFLTFAISTVDFTSEWSARIAFEGDAAAGDLELVHYNGDTEVDTTLQSATASIPYGQWVRIEIGATNAASGSGELRLYTDMDGTTPAKTLTGNITQPVAEWADCYVIGEAFDSELYVDDMAFSDEDWPGPGGSVGATLTPSPVAAVASVPAPELSIGTTLTPTPVAGNAVVPAPDVHTGALTTPVNPAAVVATAAVPAPTIETHMNAFVAPPAVAAVANVLVPDIGVPVNPGDKIGRAGQIEWNGFLLGSGTPYRWQSLEGWVDLPSIDSGNVPQPGRHGSYPGRDLTQERHVIYTSNIRVPREDMQVAIDELVAATRILEDDTELPLAIRVLDTIYVGYGKIARRSIPIDKLVRLGHGQLVLQWTLSDPILQSRELSSVVIPDGTWQAVANLGNAPSYPTIRIPGPCEGPAVAVRYDYGGGRVDERTIEFDVELAPGDLLVIDTYYGTAMVEDFPVMDTLTGGSVPIPDLVLPAGQSQIGYATAQGGAEAATVLWRHAIQ